jgi:hypothetical protein
MTGHKYGDGKLYQFFIIATIILLLGAHFVSWMS